MKITNDKKTHYTPGLNTLSVLGLMLTWSVINSLISPVWLVLATPCMLLALGLELQERKPSLQNTLKL